MSNTEFVAAKILKEINLESVRDRAQIAELRKTSWWQYHWFTSETSITRLWAGREFSTVPLKTSINTFNMVSVLAPRDNYIVPPGRSELC